MVANIRLDEVSIQGGVIMAAESRKKELQMIATRVMEDLDGLLFVMRRAAEQISSGQAPEEIDDQGFHLYLAR